MRGYGSVNRAAFLAISELMTRPEQAPRHYTLVWFLRCRIVRFTVIVWPW